MHQVNYLTLILNILESVLIETKIYQLWLTLLPCVLFLDLFILVHSKKPPPVISDSPLIDLLRFPLPPSILVHHLLDSLEYSKFKSKNAVYSNKTNMSKKGKPNHNI